MFFSKLALAVLLSTTLAGLVTASTSDDTVAAPILARRDPQQNKGGKDGKNNSNNKKSGAAAGQAATPASAAQPAAAGAGAGAGTAKAGTATLNADALQTGSTQTGQEAGAEAGQAPSATDNANFINFCSGQVLTNGLQIKTGSCNGIPMGKIPAVTNMISAIVLFPQNNQDIPANKGFNVSVQINHLRAGFFTNPQTTYYTAPQDLDENGDIIGHTHITLQDLGASLNPTTPPDPTKFAFFKGVNDAGNGKGLLQAVVSGGLPAGNYRVCTMIAARNHQPVNMPVAQRGAQDDCTKFTVGATTSGATGGAAGGKAGGAAAGGATTGGAGTGGAAAGGLNLGSCSNPAIEFGVGFDGRKEASFQPVDKSQFNHGSAQNIDIITSFICDRIRDTCRAPQATQDKCTAAKTATNGLTGQAAADAWNKAFPTAEKAVTGAAAGAKRKGVQKGAKAGAKMGRFVERTFVS